MICDNLDEAFNHLIDARRLVKDWGEPLKPQNAEEMDATGRYFLGLGAALCYIDKAIDEVDSANGAARELCAPIDLPSSVDHDKKKGAANG